MSHSNQQLNSPEMEVNQSNQPQDDKIDSLVRKITNEFKALFAEFRSQSEQSEERQTPPNPHSRQGVIPDAAQAAICAKVAEQLQQQGVTLSVLLDKANKIEGSVKDFTYKEEINNRLHDELQKYKNGLRKEFVTPLLKGVIREYDRTMRQYRYYSAEAQTSEYGDAFANLLKQFEMTAFGLLDLLSDYDIEPFEPKEGDPFNGKEHKPLELTETDDETKNNTIAECIACGFRDISTDRMMRHAEVKIYKQK